LISFEKRIIIGESDAHECWSAIDNDFIINIVHGDGFDYSLIFFGDDWCIDSPYTSNYETINDSSLAHFKARSLNSHAHCKRIISRFMIQDGQLLFLNRVLR